MAKSLTAETDISECRGRGGDCVIALIYENQSFGKLTSRMIEVCLIISTPSFK